jgi:hypothetical protein
MKCRASCSGSLWQMGVAAHHGPTSAFQTIKLDRACLGSILKGSWHSGDGQKACFRGFQKCTIFAQQTGPRTKSFRGKFSPPFFFALMGMVWPLTYLRTKGLVKFGPKPAFLHPYHLSGREMAQIQPPTLILDPKLIDFMQKCYIYA